MIREESGYWKNGAFYPYIKGEYYLENPEITINGEKVKACIDISFKFRATREEDELLRSIQCKN